VGPPQDRNAGQKASTKRNILTLKLSGALVWLLEQGIQHSKCWPALDVQHGKHQLPPDRNTFGHDGNLNGVFGTGEILVAENLGMVTRASVHIDQEQNLQTVLIFCIIDNSAHARGTTSFTTTYTLVGCPGFSNNAHSCFLCKTSPIHDGAVLLSIDRGIVHHNA
jgi:hypothetical protein